MLTVTLYPDADSIAMNEGHEVDVKFVSLVNNETYGPPALIAPTRGANTSQQPPRADLNEDVLYINTNLIPAFKIRRTAN